MSSDSDDDDIAALLEAPVHTRKKTKARKSTSKKKENQREKHDKKIPEARHDKDASIKKVTFSDDANLGTSSDQKNTSKFKGDLWKPKAQRSNNSLDFNMDDIMGLSHKKSEAVQEPPSKIASSHNMTASSTVRPRNDNTDVRGSAAERSTSRARSLGSDSNRIDTTRTTTEEHRRREPRAKPSDPMPQNKSDFNADTSSYIKDTHRRSQFDGKTVPRRDDLAQTKQQEIVAMQKTIAALKIDIATEQRRLVDEQARRNGIEAELQGASRNASEERTLLEASHKRELDELHERYERQLKEMTKIHEKAASDMKNSNQSQHEHSKELLASVSKQIESSIETFKSLKVECGTIKATIENCNTVQVEAGELNVRQWKSLIELESSKLQNATQQLAQVFQRNEDDHRRHFNAEASRLDKLQVSLSITDINY